VRFVDVFLNNFSIIILFELNYITLFFSVEASQLNLHELTHHEFGKTESVQ